MHALLTSVVDGGERWLHAPADLPARGTILLRQPKINGLPISKSFKELILVTKEHTMAVNVNTVITSRDILEGSSDSIVRASAWCCCFASESPPLFIHLFNLCTLSFDI